MKGLCPFHEEKTPSFSVDPERQLFYCFGCQTGGDVFKFYMLYEKVAFPEAIEALAVRWGVPLPESHGGHADPRSRTLELNHSAAQFFKKSLEGPAGAPCRAYLEQRGIDLKTAYALGLGYAPEGWEALGQYLRSQRFSPKEILDAGLAIPRKGGTGEYDRFRNRLTFAIADLHGKVVAFGGRALGDEVPKYINSPETAAYIKGNHLYGLNLAGEAIRAEGLAVVVEGYLDRVALVQAGFRNVVASLGTAFTPNQARLLARYTERIVVSYDGDAAGGAATRRSLDMLLSKGFAVRVVELPEGQDPDDTIRVQGAEAYGVLLRQAPDYLEFLIRQQVKERDLSALSEKVTAVNAVLPHIVKLPNAIERGSWAARLADLLQIEEGLVLQELRAALSTAQPTIRTRAPQQETPRDADCRLVALLLRSEAERAYCATELDPADLEGSPVAPLVKTILDLVARSSRVDYPAVLEALENEADRDLLTRIAFQDEPDEGPTVADCLCAFKRQRLELEGRAVVSQIGRSLSGARAPRGAGGHDDAPAAPAGSAGPEGPEAIDRQLQRLQDLVREREQLM